MRRAGSTPAEKLQSELPATRRLAQLLRALPLFRQVSAAEIDLLAGLVRPVHAQRKQVLYSKGESCDGFYAVVFGKVKLTLVSTRGLEKPLEIVGPGGTLGDVTMFLDRPFYLSATVLEDSLLIFVPRRAVLGMIERDASFALRMLASLSTRMRNVVDDIESFALQPPAARLVTYLMRMLPEGSCAPVKIDLDIRKNLVAAQLNLAPETLSRYFRELSDRGLISLEGRTVIVHDIDRLGDFVASLP